MNQKILIIDDDNMMRDLIRVNLEQLGYEIVTAGSGHEAILIVKDFKPDLILLDIMMPEMDGYEVCNILKQKTEAPILFLTAKSQTQDLVRGFEVGADDYVKKPFSLRELEARIQALIKRASLKKQGTEITQFNDGILKIDLETRHVYKNGRMVHLTPTEFRLLGALVRKMGKVMAHEELLREAWGEAYLDATASLSLYVRYLREKIEDDPGNPKYLMNKWGVGYWFSKGEED